MKLFKWTSAAIPALFALSAACADVGFSSSAQRTTLLELYTSEGCSSCPPADRWLSKMKDDPRLWRDIVPVAFHVDYWDYLGWRDRFAHSSHSERQRRYAELGDVSTVYTPGFIVDGKEWRGWFRSQPIPVAAHTDVGVLSVQLGKERASATFAPVIRAAGELQLNVVWLGLDLSSEVAAGENSDRRLDHNFVALSWRSFPASSAADGDDIYRWQFDTARPEQAAKAVALWVSRTDAPTPLQAVGGWVSGDL